MRRIFITGATGFIGGRLAEVAVSRGLDTVALVRTWSRAARLARLPVTMVEGDVLDAEAIARGMTGCDTVFHCAVDNRAHGKAHRDVSGSGTANVMRAAKAAGVSRVVHISSAAVYGYRPGPTAVTESGTVAYTGDDYCDGKIDSEKAALAAHRDLGLSVTVLRPTIVYGPFGDYSRDTVGLVRQGRMTLVNGGRGICNALYVDNLVEAMFLAATSPRAVGEVFHVSDAAPVSWRDFIEGHAHAIGWADPLPEITSEGLRLARRAARPSSMQVAVEVAHDVDFRRKLRRIPIVDTTVRTAEQAARTILPERVRPRLHTMLFGPTAAPSGFEPSQAPAPSRSPAPLALGEELMISAFEGVAFSIEKARERLGYAPAIDFAEGMQRTAEWLRWARL